MTDIIDQTSLQLDRIPHPFSLSEILTYHKASPQQALRRTTLTPGEQAGIAKPEAIDLYAFS